MSHFREVCRCGRVLNQCRCPATDKATRVIAQTCSGCTEKPAAVETCEGEAKVNVDDIDVTVMIALPRHGWRALAIAARIDISNVERQLSQHTYGDPEMGIKRVSALQRFLAQITLTMLVLCLCAGAARAREVVVIVADDLRVQDVAFMPNLQALARDGVSFSAAVTAYPLCTPSRVSLLTGKSPDHHGVLVNHASLVPKEWPTIGSRLQAAGWRTGMFGKWLNGMTALDDTRWPGWDRWFALMHHRDFGREQTTVLANKAARFVRECRDDGVDCLAYVSPAAPHGPNLGPEECGDGSAVPIPSGYMVDAKRWQQRMSSVCGLDLLIGKLARLEPEWLIVVGDNGYMMENGRVGKNELVWDALNVPLVICAPQAQHGVDRREVVTLMDVAATVLDAAGVATEIEDGHTLRPLLGPIVDDPPAWTGTLVLMGPPPTSGEED